MPNCPCHLQGQAKGGKGGQARWDPYGSKMTSDTFSGEVHAQAQGHAAHQGPPPNFQFPAQEPQWLAGVLTRIATQAAQEAVKLAAEEAARRAVEIFFQEKVKGMFEEKDKKINEMLGAVKATQREQKEMQDELEFLKQNGSAGSTSRSGVSGPNPTENHDRNWKPTRIEWKGWIKDWEQRHEQGVEWSDAQDFIDTQLRPKLEDDEAEWIDSERTVNINSKWLILTKVVIIVKESVTTKQVWQLQKKFTKMQTFLLKTDK